MAAIVNPDPTKEEILEFLREPDNAGKRMTAKEIAQAMHFQGRKNVNKQLYSLSKEKLVVNDERVKPPLWWLPDSGPPDVDDISAVSQEMSEVSLQPLPKQTVPPPCPPSLSLDQKLDDALVALLPDLRTGLSLDGDLLPRLERPAGGFMTKAERAKVQALPSDFDRVSEIVDILRKKSNEDFSRFLVILDESGNELWAKNLRDRISLGSLPSSPTPSSSPSTMDTSSQDDHEVALLDKCWIPFGIRTVQIQQSGGTYCLEPMTSEFTDDTDEQQDDKDERDSDPQDQNTFRVEVPDGAMKQESLEVRYGIVFTGPFKLPQEYRLASLVLYISFDDISVTKPVQIRIPHWMAQVESFNAQDCPLVIASHEPKDSVEYTFSPMDRECCTVNAESSTIELSGHCCLFAQAMRHSRKNQSLYYATAWEKLKASDYTIRIAVVYGVPMWIKVLNTYFPENSWTKKSVGLHHFKFASDHISVLLQPCSGPGWEAVMDRDVLIQSEVDFSRMYLKAKDMKEAFDEEAYPPSMYAHVTQNCEPQRYINRKQVCLSLSGTNLGTLRFPFNVQEVDDQIETELLPSSPCTSNPSTMDTSSKDLIDSTTDLQTYVNRIIPYLEQLGPALGVSEHARAVMQEAGAPQAKCIKILQYWLDCTAAATWTLLCQKLSKVSEFTALVANIKRQKQTAITKVSEDLLDHRALM